jgi:predicted O-methyltransferase YrrM
LNRALARATVALLQRSTSARVAAVNELVGADPRLAIPALTGQTIKPSRFADTPAIPEHPKSFEQLAFLFASSQLNHRIALLTFEEAAYLYGLARDLENASIAEIGRFKGGSTFLLAAAVGPGSRIYSYDIHAPLFDWPSGDALDRDLREGLRRAGIEERVEIHVADSKTVEPPAEPCAIVFIDGDHSYDGARADYENWRGSVAPGGHLLLHDAVPAGTFGIFRTEVAQLAGEIERDDSSFFRRVGSGGSIADFVRTDLPAQWSRRRA